MPTRIFWHRLLLGFTLVFSTNAMARSVFLNGTDISSARSQELKNVSIVINEKGDVFIIAPHYQVHEEDSYVPLSKFVQGLNTPTHKGAGGLPGHPGLQGAKGQVKTASDGQVVKAGDKNIAPPADMENSARDKDE